MRFRDRSAAGRALAAPVHHALAAQDDLAGDVDRVGRDVVVLGVPRGGVPVAFEVALALGVPLDVIVVRKLGVPFQPELAMGAIGEDGVRVDNDEVLRAAGVASSEIAVVEARERTELERRARQYRAHRPRIDLRGACAVVIDDGVATGSSIRAACQVARAHGAARVVVAVPVASRQAVVTLADVCDQLIALETPEPFFAVGEWYEDFSQTTDEEVVSLLSRAASHAARSDGVDQGDNPRGDQRDDQE
jgi:putative phosphoribosyl transferase